MKSLARRLVASLLLLAAVPVILGTPPSAFSGGAEACGDTRCPGGSEEGDRGCARCSSAPLHVGPAAPTFRLPSWQARVAAEEVLSTQVHLRPPERPPRG